MKTLQQIINKSDWYYINDNLTSDYFPKPHTIKTVGAKLIKMGKSFSSQQALDEIKRQGCRPANAWELAEWANKHREEMEKGSCILAFGQVPFVDGCHRVPLVDARSGGGFRFDLGDFESDWHDDFVLLAFCDKNLPLDTGPIEKSSDSLSLPSKLIINGITYIKDENH